MGAKAHGVCARGSVVGCWWALAARARENFGACVEAILPFGTERAELGAMITAITRDEPKPRVPLLSGRAAREWRRIGRRRIVLFVHLGAIVREKNVGQTIRIRISSSRRRIHHTDTRWGCTWKGDLARARTRKISCSSTKLCGFVLKVLPTQNKINSAASSRDACG